MLHDLGQGITQHVVLCDGLHSRLPTEITDNDIAVQAGALHLSAVGKAYTEPARGERDSEGQARRGSVKGSTQ